MGNWHSVGCRDFSVSTVPALRGTVGSSAEGLLTGPGCCGPGGQAGRSWTPPGVGVESSVCSQHTVGKELVLPPQVYSGVFPEQERNAQGLVHGTGWEMAGGCSLHCSVSPEGAKEKPGRGQVLLPGGHPGRPATPSAFLLALSLQSLM